MRARGRGSVLAPGLEVVAHLRRGSDLDVYDAWDATRGCRVVVKALRPDKSPGGEAARRLRAEARLLLRLAHPNLVRAYELRTAPVPARSRREVVAVPAGGGRGSHRHAASTSTTPSARADARADAGSAERGRPLLVLETLPGHTVSALVEEAPLRVPEAAVLGQQVGSALAYLHAHDRVHLDVKPSNVVAAGGRAVLLDLSVARRPGRVTPGYGTWCSLAPEQARGDRVGPAADVWGLGLLLHECVTGEPAFDVEGETDDHPQTRRRAPRTRTGTALDDLLAATLEPDPAARPPLPDLLRALEVLGGSPK